MVRKERFEMRLDEQQIQKIDEWADKQVDKPARAEAIRRLLDTGLSYYTDKSVHFSDGEKVLIWMLGDVYKNLKIKNGNINPDFFQDVISGGHYWAPKWDHIGVFHDDVDHVENVRFVVDVLDMWSFVEDAFEELADKYKKKINEGNYSQPIFIGFDRNNESEFLSITRFLIEKMGRFPSFKNREYNSHCPVVARYRKMLNVFLPMRENLVGKKLSADQICKILERN